MTWCGEYEVFLKEINPIFVELGKENAYFSNEQVQVWGIDEFWGLPHYPKVKYYRGLTKKLSDTSKLFEFIVPTFPVNWLDEETVELYKSIISDNQSPTVLCLSILDIKEPADYDEKTKYPEHWCLTHYIIDGHHKMYASSLVNKPISVLSFLSVKNSIANIEDILKLYSYL